jgi:8-oxo-dGTP diphosphatase
MAFDHYNIVKSAYQYMRDKVAHFSLIWEFLSKEFTLTELQRVYEILMLSTTDWPNFRKKAIASWNLKATGHFQITWKTRPAQLYRFVKA